MPMECHRVEREPATSGSSWNVSEWPFMPEDMRQQIEADKDKPKATERLYSEDGRLVVAPGMVLPDNAADLFTEDQILGREPRTQAAEPSTEGPPVPRRKVRRK